MAKITLDTVVSGFKSAATFISNNILIATELNDKVLYRDNPLGEANQMENEIDMNSNLISNLSDGIANTDAVNKLQAETILSVVQADLITSAAQAVQAANDFRGIYYGQYATDPSADPLGNAMTEGDMYYNTVSDILKTYDGITWNNIYSGIQSIQETLQTIATDSSIATGNNGFSVGDIIINTGVTVTVPALSSWLVL